LSFYIYYFLFRFEFRAVGSSQNVSLVNTVLNTITAKAFKEFADAIEKGQKPADVAKKALESSWKVIYLIYIYY
jgi:glutamine synthetase